MKIFECLMLGLLATSAMVPAINAAEATKEDASVRRVFLYDAPASYAEKELYFKFKSLFSNVCREMGAKIQGLHEYLLWKPREGILPTMHDGFQQALTQGIDQLHVALGTIPSLNRGRVLGLFDALAAREFRAYQGLFAQADELIGYLNTTTLPDPDPSVTSNYAFLNGCSIMISPIDPEAQFHYLAVAHQLGFESNRLKVLSPSLIDTNQASWSLLAYLTNTSDVKATDGTCYPVKQEALNIFHAYGHRLDPKAAEYQFLTEMLPESSSYNIEPPLHFDLAEARGIATIMAGGNPPPPYTPQPSIVIGKAEILAAARVGSWNASVVSYVPTEDVADGLVQAVQKMAVADMPPPPPKVVELFSPQAKLDFERVKTTLDTLHVAQEIEYAAGRKYRGYSQDEQIMAYGNDSVIPAALRVDVSQLLTDQLGLRSISVPGILTVEKAGTAKGYDAAASYMADWIREKITKDGLAVKVAEVSDGLMYTMNKAKTHGSRDDNDLFNTMWALRAVSMHYDALTEAQVGKQAKDEIQSLLAQSFGMIIEHNGRCATGAKGRNFLMQFNMLRFFKDYHPTTLA